MFQGNLPSSILVSLLQGRTINAKDRTIHGTHTQVGARVFTPCSINDVTLEASRGQRISRGFPPKGDPGFAQWPSIAIQELGCVHDHNATSVKPRLLMFPGKEGDTHFRDDHVFLPEWTACKVCLNCPIPDTVQGPAVSQRAVSASPPCRLLRLHRRRPGFGRPCASDV